MTDPRMTTVAQHNPLLHEQTEPTLVGAFLLCLFFGHLGIHRMYAGRRSSGMLMLKISCTIVGCLITVPWAFVDLFRCSRFIREWHQYGRGII